MCELGFDNILIGTIVHENCVCLSCILQTEDKVGVHD